MNTDDENIESRGDGHPSHQIRLPGFITDDQIGLGDLIRRVTSAAGIRPCGGCERRAALLNRWMAFDSRPRND